MLTEDWKLEVPDSSAALPFDPIAEARRQWVAHGWAQAADGMTIITSLMRAHQLLLARVDEQLRPYDLSFARYEILMLLTFSGTGALPLGKVGQRLQVRPASVTSAMDRLERQGFVRRLPHPSDRRAVLAEITATGRRIALDATGVLNKNVFGDLGMDRKEIRQVIVALESLRRSAGDFV